MSAVPGLSWEELEPALAGHGIALPAGALGGLRTLARLLREGGGETNLTAIEDERAVVELHLLDALVALPYLELAAGGGAPSLVDVGSGCGVPGLPLALACPDLRVVLLEPRERRAGFLARAVVALGLGAHASVERARAEAYGQGPGREAFAAAVARALGSVPACLELALPLVRPGGRALLYRGPDVSGEELSDARRVAPLLGGGEVAAHDLVLRSGAGRRLLVVRKVALSPARYPRRDGVPARRPL